MSFLSLLFFNVTYSAVTIAHTTAVTSTITGKDLYIFLKLCTLNTGLLVLYSLESKYNASMLHYMLMIS